MKRRETADALGILALIAVIVLGGAVIYHIIANPPPPYQIPRHEGVVVVAVCATDRDSAIVVNMNGTERSFDVLLRDCALASAHVGDVVSFEISPGGTAAWNLALVEDRP